MRYSFSFVKQSARRLDSIRRRAIQTVGNRAPLGGFRRGFDNNQLRASFITAMQLGINRPRERLRVMRDHAYMSETFVGRDVRVRDDVCQVRRVRCQVRAKFGVIFPIQHDELCLRRIMFSQ